MNRFSLFGRWNRIEGVARKTLRMVSVLALLLSASAVAPRPASAAASLPPNGKVAPTNDVMTYYEEYGAGEPLIVMHGSLGSTVDFSRTVPALAKEFRVILIDSRGRGRSSDSIKPMTYDQMMSDTIKLLDVLGITKTHILGWSDGAIIGLDMAIHHPERIRSLVSYGGQYTVEAGTDWFDQFVRVMSIDDVKDWADAYRAVSPQPERAELELEKVRSMLLYQPEFTKKQMRSISVPVFVLDGENEEIVEPGHAKEMAKLIPGAKLTILKGTGHFAPYEMPEQFTKVVLDYLRAHKGG